MVVVVAVAAVWYCECCGCYGGRHCSCRKAVTSLMVAVIVLGVSGFVQAVYATMLVVAVVGGSGIIHWWSQEMSWSAPRACPRGRTIEQLHAHPVSVQRI